MQIKKIENNQQKMIVTGLIVSDEFCKNIINILTYNKQLAYSLFSGVYKIVLNWSIQYYKKYQKAIHKYIQNVYEESFNKQEYKTQEYELLSTFLNSLSENYERQENFNEKYIIDQAKIYLREANLKLLKQNIDKSIENNNIDIAEKYIQQYKYVETNTETIESCDLFDDVDDIEEVISEQNEKLFTFHGAFGELVGDINRGELYSFSAPAKVGKTQWLFETAFTAIQERLRVIEFSFEMTKNQCRRRKYQMICGEVKKLPEKIKFKEVEIPCFSDDIFANIEIKTVKKRGLTARAIKKKLLAMKQMLKGSSLHLVNPPMYSMSIAQMSKYIDDKALEGFVPDVIIVDYADIMAKEGKEYRHDINLIWQGLRKLAQEKNCAVFTATHTGRNSFGKDQTEENIVEDIRKMNHVALMIALNQNDNDKENYVIRPAILAGRHAKFNKKRQVIVLHNYEIGKPYLDSKFTDQVNYQSNKKSNL